MLNIFLRDCFYTSYLEKAYRLARSEDALEIPLDSITGRKLDDLSRESRGRKWRGLKQLEVSHSDAYQATATAEAHRLGIARVHLDAVWWSMKRDDADQ